MFRSLFGNTLVSTAAFFFVGLVGLLLVPVLLGQYGLAGFGLIMLARLFLPGAGLGVFDFGISEIATQLVSTAHVDGDWPRARQRLSALTGLTLVTALLVASLLALFAPELADAFSVQANDRTSFIAVLGSTACLLPALFVSLLLEGCLKGFEGFKALRGAEVLATLAFAGGAVAACQWGLGFAWIVWIHLASLVLRAALITRSVARASPQALSLHRQVGNEARTFVNGRARMFFTARLLGAAQHQSPPILIGLTVGPQGVGLYDALARLPRFAKSVLGILNTTLLPYATRLDAAGDAARLRLLNVFGFTLLPAIVFPPLAAAAALSAPTLHFWIGDNFTPFAAWLALFWALPAMNTIVSFQNYVLMSRLAYIKSSNWMSAVQVLIQTLLSLVLVSHFAQFSFIVGYIGAAAVLFGWQLHLARREIHTPGALVLRLLAFSAAMVGFVVATHASGVTAMLGHVAALVAAFVLTSVALTAVACLVFLGTDERRLLVQVLSLARRRRR